MELCDALAALKKELPPIFLGKNLTELTKGAFNWRTFQNMKCRGKVPEGVLLRSGNRNLLVVRDPFLEWWQSRLTKA